MRGELIALDLETTGLDANTDTIIEIGAVRLRDGQVIDEYATLINPDRPLPDYITFLTGITDQDFQARPATATQPARSAAPRIIEVIPAIRDFVGDAPIIGHNIGFDLAFLQRHGLFQRNLSLDTLDLAPVLLPRAPRYNLSSLCQYVNVPLDEAHRALEDARASGLLYWALWQRALELPTDTLREIAYAAAGFDWNSGRIFEAAMDVRGIDPAAPHIVPLNVFQPAPDSLPLTPGELRQTLSTANLTATMNSDGALARQIPSYELRHQQVEMMHTVAAAFNNAEQILIEAGSGSGKSLAYLLPAARWGQMNGERVVISANTSALQEQLLLKDIPTLSAALDQPIRAAVLKDREQYLCPRRLEATRRRKPESLDELRVIAKVLVWLLESSSGDKTELALRGAAEHDAWARLSAADDGCTASGCESAMAGTCPFHKARKAAASAHLVVVNHALLISDSMSDNPIVPDFRYLVIEEAHQLEDAVTSALSRRMDEAALHRRLAEIGNKKRGLLGGLLANASPVIPAKNLIQLTAFVEAVSEAAVGMEVGVHALFENFRDIFKRLTNDSRSGDYAAQVRLTPELYTKGTLSVAQATWQRLDEYFAVIYDRLLYLVQGLARLKQFNIPDFDDLVNGVTSFANHLSETRSVLNGIVRQPDPNTIYWLNSGQNLEYLSLNMAPLNIGPYLKQHIWEKKDAVVIISETLRTNGGFDYIRHRLAADHFSTTEIASPFDYRSSTLLYMPNDIADPNDRYAYQQMVERGIIELAAALGGRLLVLFTSYTQLRQTAQAITPRLSLGDITVYDQSEASSRQNLLDTFKSINRAVLLGTKSIWEGVDIPGDSLSGLIITKLPFSVPNEPIFAARAETYDDPFNKYNLPDAILRFRQGFSRLIRTQTDRGVVAIFDHRMMSKKYGQEFLEALPDCTVQYGALDALPKAARKWLNLD
jgi:DNA polymerase-3 subunit epsilon/ATP-dependent DNA helicase DinG